MCRGRFPENKWMYEIHLSYRTTNKLQDYLYFKMYGTSITLLLSQRLAKTTEIQKITNTYTPVPFSNDNITEVNRACTEQKINSTNK